jgi:hypothetical protein
MNVHRSTKLLSLPIRLALTGAVLLGFSSEVAAQVSVLKTGEELQCMAFSPDGRFLATGGKSRVVKIWELYSGEVALSITLPVDPDRPVKDALGHQLSPKESEQDKLRRRKAFPVDAIGIAYSPDGTQLAVKFLHTGPGVQEATVFLCDPKTGAINTSIEMSYNPWPDFTKLRTFEVGNFSGGGGGGFISNALCPSVAFSCDSAQVMAADGALHIWDRKGNPVRTLGMDAGIAAGFAVSKGYDSIAQISSEGLVEVTDLVGKRAFQQKFLRKPTAVAISADARYVVVGGEDRTTVLTMPKGKIKFISKQTEAYAKVTAVAVSPRGDLFASGNDRGMMEVKDEKNQRVQVDLPKLPSKVVAAAFSPNGSTLAYASACGVVQFQDVPTK